MYTDPLTGKQFSSKTLLILAKKHLAPNYAPPDDIIVTEGQGCWLSDINGVVFFDGNACYSAVPTGHKPGELPTIPRSLHHPERILMARDIAKFCGGGLTTVLPMNGGAEAYDTQLKLVRKWGYTRRNIPNETAEIIVARNNFHGRTLAAASASTIDQYRRGFEPLVEGYRWVTFGDIFSLEKALTANTVAVVLEPIQGEGGIIVPPNGYLKMARDLCRKHKILFVLDEIQTGFGRTGTRFAYDHENAEPDVLLLGKAVAGGFPAVSMVVSGDSIMNVFEPGDHGSTFGGNPSACRHVRQFLHDFKQQNLAVNAHKRGRYLLNYLRKIAKKSRVVKEVRGKGLFIGIELKENQGMDASELSRLLRKNYVITIPAKEYILRFTPPLTINEQECNFVLNAFEKVLIF